mmetsp:Transcript_3438/g.4987  ORF Transcript_3438/g.4987 Transcript_3438/m.4987 type:complete len:87 (-) Transcript_3438:2244-2504(-)
MIGTWKSHWLRIPRSAENLHLTTSFRIGGLEGLVMSLALTKVAHEEHLFLRMIGQCMHWVGRDALYNACLIRVPSIGAFSVIRDVS